MPTMYITKDGAKVLGALLDRYYSSGHPCFKLNHEDECASTPIGTCKNCKHGKALQNLISALYRAGGE